MLRFKQILCLVDTESPEEASLERAVKIAENSQARLMIVTMVPGIRTFIGIPGGSNPAVLQKAVVDERMQELQSLIEPHSKRVKIETKALQGSPFLEIIREVLRNQHDLVIKSPDRQDYLDRLLGSDDMHLLRKCPCPVWIIKPRAPRSCRRVMAAVDVDDSYPPEETRTRSNLNHRIVELASSLALAESAELHVVHAWHAPAERLMRGPSLQISEQQVSNYVEQLRRKHNDNLKILLRKVSAARESDDLAALQPKMHLLKGYAREEIPSFARQIDADLIVMGTVGRTGVPGVFMGNTAETILNQIDCSVLAIKPPGFTTPVELEA